MPNHVPVSGWAGVILVILTGALPRTASAGAAGAGEELAPVGVTAVRSVDAVAAFAAQVGLPLPPQLSAAGIEAQFAFLGRGWLAADQPIGFIAVGGEEVKAEQAMVFVLPVEPEAVTLDLLKQLGGNPAPGRADMVVFKREASEAAYRRTAGHVLFGTLPAAVAAADPAVVGNAFATRDVLALATLDFAAVRRCMPQRYQQYQKALEHPLRALDARFYVDKLDHVAVTIDHGEAGVRVAATARPLAPAVAGGAPRYALPPGCFFRLDAALSLAGPARELGKVLAADVRQQVERGGRRLTERQSQQVDSLFSRAFDLWFGADATTVGVELAGDAIVAYLVQHYAGPTDYAAELLKTADDLNGFAAAVGREAPMRVSTYSISAVKVTRARLAHLPDGAPDARGGFVIDAVQRGQEVFITVSRNELRYIDRLLAAKPERRLPGLAAAWLDLDKFLDSAAAAGGRGLPRETVKQLGDILRGHRVTMAASAKGDAVTVDLTVPSGLVRDVPKLQRVLLDAQLEARRMVAKTDVTRIAAAIGAFERDAGRYPTAAEGLAALSDRPAGLRAWNGPYVQQPVPKDPWGRPYIYRVPGTHHPNGYDLFSVGPDGREGGGDDVTNWAQR